MTAAMKEQTGFADVDASGRSGELVDYLVLTAEHVADIRRNGYEFLRLQPGASVLDVGCGAGEVCVELAARVGPAGKVAGIDLSEAMIEAARKAAAASERPIDLRVGSAYALPFADGQFDAVRCERVFQHLDDPEAALREILRVTRSGGRVMVLDPDHGQAGLGLDDPVHRRTYRAIQRQMESMIVNPHSGTRLRGMLLRAGLLEVAVSAFVLEIEHGAYMKMFFVRERIAAAVTAGDISDDQGREFHRGAGSAAPRGDVLRQRDRLQRRRHQALSAAHRARLSAVGDGPASHGAGSAEVRLALAMLLSETVIVPLALMSAMKFAAVTNCASCPVMRPTSDTVTTRLWLTSPSRNPARADAALAAPPSAGVTFVSRTVTYCALATLVRLTTTSLPLNVGAAAIAVPSVTAAVALVIGLSNVKTSVCAGPLRGSVDGFNGVTARGRSKVPAVPWTLRDTVPCSTAGAPGTSKRIAPL